MGCHNARTLTCNHVAGTPAPAVVSAAAVEEEDRLAEEAAEEAAASQPQPRGEVYQ